MKQAIFALLLFPLPLAAQQPAPTPTSAVVATHSADAEPEQSIHLLRAQMRAQIAAGRRELKAAVAFQEAALKLSEAQIRLQIVRRQDEARLATAKAAK